MGQPSVLPALALLLLSFPVRNWAFQAATPLASRTQHSSSDSALFSTQQALGGVDVSTNAPRNSNNFVGWASHFGVSLENYQLNTQDPNNWNGHAVQAAPAGSRVLYVPAMIRLTSQRAKDEEFADVAPFIDKYIDATTSNGEIGLVSHFYLFLKVLKEYEQGSNSAYVAWLDALPRKFHSALEFDNKEMDCLPPFVKYLAGLDRHNYELFVEVLVQLNIPSISEATKMNTLVTKWAFNVVFTRARSAFGQAEIIPMPDMLNHNSNPNVEVQYDGEGNVHVVLLRDVQAGEPLYKCYGQPTNPSRFLATYGFFDMSPPATYCKILPTAVLTPELKNMGFDFSKLVFYPENGGVSQEVWDVILYILLGQTDRGQQQQLYQAHMNGNQQAKAEMHQYYKPQTLQALISHVDEMLGEIGNCERQMGNDGGMHEHIPMIQAHNQFVHQTFVKVRENLVQMA